MTEVAPTILLAIEDVFGCQIKDKTISGEMDLHTQYGNGSYVIWSFKDSFVGQLKNLYLTPDHRILRLIDDKSQHPTFQLTPELTPDETKNIKLLCEQNKLDWTMIPSLNPLVKYTPFFYRLR